MLIYSYSPEFKTTDLNHEPNSAEKIYCFNNWIYDFVKKIIDFDSFMPNSGTEVSVWFLNSGELLYLY